MDTWIELFDLELAHGYCSDVARCRLRLAPDARSAAWLAQADVQLRSRPDGLRAACLQHIAALDKGPAALPVTLHFGLFADDPQFGLYTAGLAAAGEPPPRFDSADAPPAPTGGRRLLQPAVPQCGPAGPCAAWLPHFVITLRVSAPGQRWRLALAPRALVWKYILVGDWAAEQPQVVDTAGVVEFEPASEEPLASGLPALAIRSTSRLPLQECSEQRFLLRGRSGNRPRDLVKRLPVASATQLGLDQRGGTSTLVSEIFVQRPSQR